MPNMTIFRFGDVLLVAFPFAEAATSKHRPAAVVSSPGFHELTQTVIVVSITSALDLPGARLIHDSSAAGLLRPSAFAPQVTTLALSRVFRPLGRLSGPAQHELHLMLGDIIGDPWEV